MRPRPRRRPFRTVLAACAALLVGTPTTAQTQAWHDQLWSAEFAPPGVGGPVHALLPFGDSLIVGGEFRHVRGSITGHIVRWTGGAYAPMASGLPDVVHALAVHNGELHAGGAFGVARWTGSAWVTLPGLTLFFGPPEVWALASHQGELWVGGQFDQAGAAAVHGLARWNGTTWSTPLGGGPVHTQQEPRVLALHVAANGRLCAGGEFERMGAAAAANVAELAGTPAGWRGLGSGTDRTVRCLAEFQGLLHVGGDFDRAGGVLSPGLARWTGTTWQTLGGGLSGSAGFVQVFGLGEFAGRLVAGGRISTAGGGAVASIAQWDGSSWSSPGAGVGNTPGFDALPRAFATFGGDLHTGGDFTRVGAALAQGQAVVTHHLARWDGSAWHGVGTGLGTDSDVLAMTRWAGGIVVGGRFPLAGGQFVSGLAWYRGGEARFLGAFDGPVLDAVDFLGDLVVTGQFQHAGGTSARQIARFDGSQWHPLGNGAGEYCVAVYQNELYAGGIGSPRRWNGIDWQSFGTTIFGAVTAMTVHQGMLYVGGNFSGGGLSPSLVAWDGTSMQSVGGGVNGYGVGALTSYGNDLIVGGTFTTAGGVTARNIAAWDGVQFRALGNGVPGASVHALTVLHNQLWVGGDLGRIVNAPEHRYVATWDGTSWSLPGRGPTGAVLTLCADTDRDQVWVGGWFYECSGMPAWNLARYDAPPGFQDLGGGSPTTNGIERPLLRGFGLLQAPAVAAVQLEAALPGAIGLHVAGLARVDRPLFGGVLVPDPLATAVFVTDATGGTAANLPILAPLPVGTELSWQCLVLDPRTLPGVMVSNAIRQRSY
jgi:hypothetical protein